MDLGSETAEFVDGLARRLHGTVLPAEDGGVPAEWRTTLDEAARQIGECSAGTRTAFELPIDLRVSDWDRLVLTGAARLRYGETVGYGELARRIGTTGRGAGGRRRDGPQPGAGPDPVPSGHRGRRDARRLRRIELRRPPGRPGDQAPLAADRGSVAGRLTAYGRRDAAAASSLGLCAGDRSVASEPSQELVGVAQ